MGGSLWSPRFLVCVFSAPSLFAVFVSVGAYELFVGFVEGEDGFWDVVGLVFGGVFVFAVFVSVPFREGEFSDGEVFAVGGSLVFPDAGSEGSDLVAPEWRVGDVYFWNPLLVVLHGFSPLFFFITVLRAAG